MRRAVNRLLQAAERRWWQRKKERKGFALSRSPTRVDIYVNDFPGLLNNFVNQ
jgi:hypothetical protein